MALKLYTDLLSPPCRAVQLLMAINKIPFESIRIDIGKKRQFSPEFLAVNPFHKIPVLVDGDTKVLQSSAALRYLAATRDLPSHWYPLKDPKQCAAVEEFLHWQHRNLFLNAVRVFVTAFSIPNLEKKTPNFKTVHSWVKLFRYSCREVENVFLSSGDFIGNRSEISVADLVALTILENPLALGFGLEETPKLRDYVERVIEATQPHFDETHKILAIVESKFADGIQKGYREYTSNLSKEDDDDDLGMSIAALSKGTIPI